ncbi:MAG: hypothetical protein H8E12_10845 [Rhodobacteraceae bacterium]|nr:hypothetical protein [Paracoccaceae bacterium]
MTNRLEKSDIRYFSLCVNPNDIDTLRDSKDLFLKSKDKPIVVIDASLEGESASFLYPRTKYELQTHNGSGLGGLIGDQTILELLHRPDIGLSEYDLDKTILLYGDANIEKNYTKWCKENNQKPVFGKCIYNPHTLIKRSLEFYLERYDYSSYDYIPNESFKPKHFVCLNAFSKPHRFEMVNFLYRYNLQNKGHISWLNRHGEPIRRYSRYYSELEDNVFDCKTLELDFTGPELGISSQQLQVPPQYREACFDIVNESSANDEDIFITEKTWKAILQKTPFIIFGSKNSHKHLEEYFGIKPYTELFDYKFDELNLDERVHSIKHNNLVRLINMDIHKLNEIVNSDKMQDLLEYNKEQLLKLFVDSARWDSYFPVLSGQFKKDK